MLVGKEVSEVKCDVAGKATSVETAALAKRFGGFHMTHPQDLTQSLFLVGSFRVSLDRLGERGTTRSLVQASVQEVSRLSVFQATRGFVVRYRGVLFFCVHKVEQSISGYFKNLDFAREQLRAYFSVLARYLVRDIHL